MEIMHTTCFSPLRYEVGRLFDDPRDSEESVYEFSNTPALSFWFTEGNLRFASVCWLRTVIF